MIFAALILTAGKSNNKELRRLIQLGSQPGESH
jgi:hypothetical protein